MGDGACSSSCGPSGRGRVEKCVLDCRGKPCGTVQSETKAKEQEIYVEREHWRIKEMFRRTLNYGPALCL